MENSIIKKISKDQEAGLHLPCPRCGCDSMYPKPSRNALSRYADVYICSMCGTDEAINGHLPFDNWSAVKEKGDLK